MNFLSLIFFCFCPITVLLYHLLPRRGKTVWLLLASWLFYLCAGPAYFPFLLFVILLSYAAGRLLERGRKAAVAVAVVSCALLLFVLKYLPFALSLVTGALEKLGMRIDLPVPGLPLPPGISFYIFQAIGYVVDVYRGRQPATRSFSRHALFLSFFPQLLSGPIARAPGLMPQIEALPSVTWDGLRQGTFRFLWGAFQKLVIADRLAVLVNTIYAAPETFGRVQILGAMVAFSFQIYCDFAAYSHMAIGIAQAMGFTLMENFRAPYFAQSIKDFWRRWHISLSTWFRDYLYIPLGGSRVGRQRTYGNLLIVFAVSGLWHGAGLTFLVWGLLHGVYQVVGNVTAPLRRRFTDRLPEKILVPLRMACTFALVTVAWVFFHASTLRQAGAVLAGTLRGPLWVHISMGLDRWELLIAGVALAVVLLADLSKRPLADRWQDACLPVRWCTALALLLITVVFGCYGPGYDAQSFIYFQF